MDTMEFVFVKDNSQFYLGSRRATIKYPKPMEYSARDPRDRLISVQSEGATFNYSVHIFPLFYFPACKTFKNDSCQEAVWKAWP